MNCRDITGAVLIASSILFIALGGKARAEGDEQVAEVDLTNLLLAIGFALLTGLVFACNAVNLKYFTQGPDKFPTNQMIYDAQILFSLYLLPLFAYY